MKKKLPNLILAIGLTVLSATFLISHYTRPDDFTAGFLKGIAIGLLILAIVMQLRARRAHR